MLINVTTVERLTTHSELLIHIRHRSDATSHSLLAGTRVLCTREFACTRIGNVREFALTRMALTREFARTRISLAREFTLNLTSWFVTRKQTLKLIANYVVISSARRLVHETI